MCGPIRARKCRSTYWLMNYISLDVCYKIAVTEKSWQNMLHKNRAVRAKFRTLKGLKGYQELPPFDKFVTEVLIFRRARSLMFFKMVFLKIPQHSQENICAGLCMPSFTGHLRWLLLDFCGSKFLSWTWYLLLTVAPAFAPTFFKNRS